MTTLAELFAVLAIAMIFAAIVLHTNLRKIRRDVDDATARKAEARALAAGHQDDLHLAA